MRNQIAFYFSVSIILFVFGGCKNDEPPKKQLSDNVKISGIFQTDFMYFNSENSIQFSFGFDEFSNEQIDGGIRIAVSGHGLTPQVRVQKAPFTILRWEEHIDGYTFVSGSCEFVKESPNDFGLVNFSCYIYQDSVLFYQIANEQFLHEGGKAEFTGEYIKTIGNLQEGYKGSHLIKCNKNDNYPHNYCHPSNYCQAYDLMLDISQISSDGIGGIDVVGSLTGYIPVYGGGEHELTPDSDIYGKHYYLGTHGWRISMRGENWSPETSGEGKYRIRYIDDCHEQQFIRGLQFINP